jgi:succinate dehydrogenase hydrophobic anchor subunit
METNKKTFNKRAFISSGLFISGFILPLGWLIHFTDIDNNPRLNELWMSIHNAATTLFVIFLIIHLTYNWKSLKAYITKSKTKLLSKEILYAAILVVFIVGLFISHLLHS